MADSNSKKPKKKVGVPFSVTEKYIAVRRGAFDIQAAQLSIRKEHYNQIYGVICDLPLSPTILCSLVCFVNGAANIFFNDGSEVTGEAVRSREVAQISRSFVIAAQNAFDSAEKVTSFPLPTTRIHYIYFLTGGGVYKLEIDPVTVNTDPVKKKIFLGYQTVMNSMQEAQLKGKARGGN